MTIDKMGEPKSLEHLYSGKSSVSSQQPSKQIFKQLDHSATWMSNCEGSGLGVDFDIDNTSSDLEQLDRLEVHTHLKFQEILAFKQPGLVLEQLLNRIVNAIDGVNRKDLLFIGLTTNTLMLLLEDNPNTPLASLVHGYIKKHSAHSAALTCQDMRQVVERLPFDLDLFLTSKFAAFSKDPYIVFTMRLLGIYSPEKFLELLDSAGNTVLFREAVLKYLSSSREIVKNMTVSKYLKILLALPDKSVHLKKVLFHQGGACCQQAREKFQLTYADFEVLGISSVSDLIQVLLPVEGRRKNLLTFLKTWFQNKRGKAQDRTCSEQRHIWSGLLIQEENYQICHESALPFFMHRGGSLYDNKNKVFSSLFDRKIFNYLGLGLLPFWESRFRDEEAKKPYITVVEVVEKVMKERQSEIRFYKSITEQKIKELMISARISLSKDHILENELRKSYHARPDLFINAVHASNMGKIEVLKILLQYIPDIVIMYLEDTDYHLLKKLSQQQIGKLLIDVPWSWTAFSSGDLESFKKNKRIFAHWENVLVNPLCWSMLSENEKLDDLIKNVTDLPLIQRILNELDDEGQSVFKLFIRRMACGDQHLTGKVERLFQLGASCWKMFIDPKHHQYGPLVYDKGYHGGLVEKGYLEGMYAGLIWCACRLSREETLEEEFKAYKALNSIVYRHNYRQVGGELRNDRVMRHNTTKVTKETLETEIEAIKEWDDEVAYPVVSPEVVEDMIINGKDTADCFSILFKESLNIKKYLKEKIYHTFNQSVKDTKTESRIVQEAAKKHKKKELLHVFRDGVSRTNWLELNLDLVRHRQGIRIIEPNDSYTCPEERWAKTISRHPQL